MKNNDDDAAKNKLEMFVKDLPKRERQPTNEHLDRVLKRAGVKQDLPCERDCDCEIGLVCRDGKCQSEW
jgi:hypothetical protein